MMKPSQYCSTMDHEWFPPTLKKLMEITAGPRSLHPPFKSSYDWYICNQKFYSIKIAAIREHKNPFFTKRWKVHAKYLKAPKIPFFKYFLTKINFKKCWKNGDTVIWKKIHIDSSLFSILRKASSMRKTRFIFKFNLQILIAIFNFNFQF